MFINPFRRLDINRKKHSSHILRQKQESEKVINKRIKITLIVICILFAFIGIRLVDLQILSQEEYQDKLVSFTAKKQSFTSPRGTIYDAKGKVLVESVNSFSAIYYPNEKITSKEEWDLASRFVDALNIKATSITERQLKEQHVSYLAVVENDNSFSVLSKKDQKKANEGKYTADEILELKIQNTDISGLSDRQKAVYQVMMKMSSGSNSEYKVIYEDLSPTQIAYLEENSSKFPGFRVKFDWKRQYGDNAKDFRSILGNISTQNQGIPEESKEYYLALGYALNERVGISGLEEQYEQYLSGTKTIYNIEIDNNGNALLNEVQSGKSGYDLTLTLDIDYQNKLDQALKDSIKNLRGKNYREYYNNAFIVVMNVNTGGILAMAGATYDEETKEIYSNPSATYLNQYRVGSVVKPATLYMGLNEGVVSPGEVINDAPMKLKGTPSFASFRNYGLINDIKAIGVSSNVYMAHIAIRLAGSKYVENGPLVVKDGTFDLMRNYFNMFGLGVKTGIDLPNEAVGAIGNDAEDGKILYYAIGQYDTYSVMQLAQYAATIANDGKRIQPHLLDRISEVNDYASTVYKYITNILSVIDGDVSFLKRSQLGMVECVNTAFCGNLLSKENVGVQMAAKSGTAEDIYIGNNVSNASMIAYGPVENPEIAIGCMAPSSNTGLGNNVQKNVCDDLVGIAAKEYFANK